MADRVEALLFDLGGVLVEIDFERAFRHWAASAGLAHDEIRSRFRFDAAYERHERGEIAPEAYFAALRSTLAIDLDDAAMARGWNAIFVREVPGMDALLASLAERWPLYLFSNTNLVHRETCGRDYARILGRFRRLFVSCELGLRKPEPAAFAAVAREIGVAPGRILFFDDTAVNVEAARASGLQAAHVRSRAEVESALSGR